ncbi:hypothetical protein BGW36DRAFT_369443 [Talaromyces proteolyticus]|uniref:Zn(2)-C6 fungal-type domain-containing protein n=1 Tax=Talaromyces proteolyticus TaxID=1131652 RepID=A0AAD4KXR9_9EURO|nr:uncharacterized protein BGW36DRAFT_369443 [Talaromyces proteolyticus]KAH8703511.1 hypothetical protein BGW36DRAFT_369443 [Talaromyces proteolyticus]
MQSPSYHSRQFGARTESSGIADIMRRRRKTVSCYDCRRRKLRCDREQPACSRCRKAGLADSCSYDQIPIPKLPVKQVAALPASPSTSLTTANAFTPAANHGSASRASESTNPIAPAAAEWNESANFKTSLEATRNSGSWQLLGRRFASAGPPNEERLAISNATPAAANSPYRPSTPDAVIFRGENFKTHYYGSSNSIGLISHFPELRSFMKDTIMHRSSLPRVQRELKALQVKWKTAKASISFRPDLDLLCLLPDKETVDHHVNIYFKTVETVYRILHYPTFAEDYEMFWDDQKAAKPAFVIILLLVMASVSCIASKGQPTYIGDSSIARERAMIWIEVSEWWLSLQSQKNVYMAIWQIRCLLLFAKQINIFKKKRQWTAAGTLIREAMSAGFHRDFSLFGERVSFFDQEMRRRLWATMLELELQASIDRGMPSASAGIPSDSAPVLNINDEDLISDCDSLPTSKPWDEYTDCSFLHLSAASFSLRVSLNLVVNDLNTRSRYEEVLNYEEAILKELERLPKWGQTKTGEGFSQGSILMMARLLLDIQLRQFLIMIHAPFARQTDNTNPRYTLSRMVCFNASCDIIERHSRLTSSSNYLLLLLRHDYFRGALVICHNMYISLSNQNNLILSSNTNMILQYLQSVLGMLEDRISRLGTGYTHHWYICAGYAFIRSVLDSTELATQMEEAVSKVTRQYHRILAEQEELRNVERQIIPTEIKRVDTRADHDQISANITNNAGLFNLDSDVSQIAFENTEQPLDEFFFGNPAAWTFENLWSAE